MKKNISLIVITLIAIICIVTSCKNTGQKNENVKIKVISSDTLTLIKEINEEVFQKIVQYVKNEKSLSFTATTKNVYDFLPLSDDEKSIQVGARRPIETGQKMKSTDLIYLMEILPDGVWTWETRSPALDKEVEKDLEEFIKILQK